MSIQGPRKKWVRPSADLRGIGASRIEVDLLVTVPCGSVEKDPVVFLFPDCREFHFARPMQTEQHAAEVPAGAPQDVFRGRENVGQKLMVSANRSVNKVL